MGKIVSKIQTVFGRVIKAIVVAALIPVAVGLLVGVLEQFQSASVSGVNVARWLAWGFCTYLGVHILLYRPAPLFRISRTMFSTLAVWLFGGQVASVEQSGRSKGKKGAAKSESGGGAQGSALVAFSPYVIPLYTVLACLLGWALRQWTGRLWVEAAMGAPISALIGATVAFHWLMTADELQQQRDQWHLETYVLALCLVFLLTLGITAACVPWALPEFSVGQAFSDGLARTHAIYSTVWQHLFL